MKIIAQYALFNLGPVVGAIVILGAALRTVLYFRRKR
jgi:hypothetical protein